MADIPGALGPPRHHFTVTAEGHEYIGASFDCRGGESFVVMLRDRDVLWIARVPKGLWLHDQTFVHAEAVERWFMSYEGPRLSLDEVKTSCQRGLDWELSREGNPVIDMLMRMGPDTVGMRRDRVLRAMEHLNPWALTIGRSAEQLHELRPRPTAVQERDGGATRHTFGEDLDGGWYGAPLMVVDVQDGRIERVLSVYLVAEYMRKYVPTRPQGD